jgi:hypothetical protein
LIRQVLGAVAQFEKAVIVSELKAARWGPPQLRGDCRAAERRRAPEPDPEVLGTGNGVADCTTMSD